MGTRDGLEMAHLLITLSFGQRMSMMVTKSKLSLLKKALRDSSQQKLKINGLLEWSKSMRI